MGQALELFSEARQGMIAIKQTNLSECGIGHDILYYIVARNQKLHT